MRAGLREEVMEEMIYVQNSRNNSIKNTSTQKSRSKMKRLLIYYFKNNHSYFNDSTGLVRAVLRE